VCAHVGNQRTHGVMIARFQSFCSEPSSSTLRSPSIDLPLTLGRSKPNISSSGIRFYVAREVLSCAFYLVFVFLPTSTEKAKKLYTFCCLIAFRTAIFVFNCFVEFVFNVVESCCWFGFVFSVCSTLLHAFGCAARLIQPLQQQNNPLHSMVCPASRLVLILYFTSPR
jgi:hypothetical protein